MNHPILHRPPSLWRNYSLPVGNIMELAVEKVGDDEERRSPSPEPQTYPRSALPRKNRDWRRLRIVKRDGSFSLIFFSPKENIWSWSWGRWSPGGPTRSGDAPHPCGLGVGPLHLILWPIFFINSKSYLREVSGHSENFLFWTKITLWQFCWKQRQSGLVSFKHAS